MISSLAAVAVGSGIGMSVVGLAFANRRYRISDPNQYLVRTGFGIKNMKVSKKGFQWPFQNATFINMNPTSFQFNLHNMSKEKVEFSLPVVFTVAPIDPELDEEGFLRYAQMLSSTNKEEITNTVRGIIEGETRASTAKLSVEELFSQKDLFKKEVVEKVENDLIELGLTIINANIKEMKDYDDDNKYFVYLKQRAIESANYEAQVEVAQARKLGEIGLKERDRDTRVQVARMDMETTIKVNENKAEVTESITKLEEVKAESKKIIDISKIEAKLFAKQRETELERETELLRQQLELEKIRADDLQPTIVKAEASVIRADGNATAIRIIADANYYKSLKRAQGNLLLFHAQAEGLKNLLEAAGGDAKAAKFYLSLRNRLIERLSEEQSRALKNLAPNISIWNNDNKSSDLLNSVQSIAPIIDGIKKHTNLNVPEWIAKDKS